MKWYSQSARDSVRVSEVWDMETALELFFINSWVYPTPNDYQLITYDSDTLRYQWFFWDDVVSNLSKTLTDTPTDPLTNKEYIYSISNKKKEFEILTLLESDIVSLQYLSKTNAATINVTPKIDWNYNWVMIKTQNYIVPVPSIINSEVNWATLILNSTNIASQIVNWWENIPNHWNINFNTWALTWLNLAVYTWSIKKTTTNSWKLDVYNQIVSTYSWSSLTNNWIISSILGKTTDEEKIALINTIILNDSTIAINLSSNSSWWASPVNWVCWTDNWQDKSSEPTNLCSTWNASTVQDNWWIWWTYTWSCNWINGWTNDSCSANHIASVWPWIDSWDWAQCRWTSVIWFECKRTVTPWTYELWIFWSTCNTSYSNWTLSWSVDASDTSCWISISKWSQNVYVSYDSQMSQTSNMNITIPEPLLTEATINIDPVWFDFDLTWLTNKPNSTYTFQIDTTDCNNTFTANTLTWRIDTSDTSCDMAFWPSTIPLKIAYNINNNTLYNTSINITIPEPDLNEAIITEDATWFDFDLTALTNPPNSTYTFQIDTTDCNNTFTANTLTWRIDTTDTSCDMAIMTWTYPLKIAYNIDNNTLYNTSINITFP